MSSRHTISELEGLIQDGLACFPDAQMFVDRAIQRSEMSHKPAFVKQGPFMAGSYP